MAFKTILEHWFASNVVPDAPPTGKAVPAVPVIVRRAVGDLARRQPTVSQNVKSGGGRTDSLLAGGEISMNDRELLSRVSLGFKAVLVATLTVLAPRDRPVKAPRDANLHLHYRD